VTPVEFTQVNKNLISQDDRDGIKPLPVYSDGERCVSCWRMSIKERLLALLTGKAWAHSLTGKTQPPIFISTENPFGSSS